MKKIALAIVCLALVAAGCSTSKGSNNRSGFEVVASVSPITDIVRNIVGNVVHVDGLIPEGVDSHTFEPTPDTARLLSRADVIFLNGLDLEDPTLHLAQANHKKGAIIYQLGPNTITSAQYVYDFSFPKSGGKPNPHLWMDVRFAIKYAELIRDELVKAYPAGAATFQANASAYLTLLGRLDRGVQQAIDTIPPKNRVLLTYHDSFAYFAKQYGMTVIGAIQPSDFAEPSGKEVAALIAQIKAEHVPAIFGSEVFPSPVLAQIGRDTGAKYEATLRDDDLPGDFGGPDHSYVGLMVYDVRTMVTDLGGNPSALDGIPTKSAYD
ncbi:MAG TPA: metal ABC transporter substrate-binding protein [Actinomycetota bacterium]|nr:metal ABC transporter substrate-binding protein [Actinomycetota bacterium]